ncbi:pyridoxamine 5'-phosphate oxidase family protein [Streptomyces sp. NPDC002784]
MRYRVFDGGLLCLLLIESASGSLSPVPARRQSLPREAAAGAGVGSVQALPGAAPACMQDLYAELDEALTACGEVEVAQLRHYIAYRRMVTVASVIFRPKHEVILVYLKVDPETVELKEGFSRDMRGIGHLGAGDLELRIASAADLDMHAEIRRKGTDYLELWNEYHLCTPLRPDARPHVVPVGVTVDADAGIARVTTRKSSRKVANMQAALPGTARVGVCQVDGGHWATLEGTAEVRTDAVTVDDAVRRYGKRYGRTPAPDPERVVIEITIDRALGHVDVPKPKVANAAA